MDYDYFQVRLGRERTAQRALADRLYTRPEVVAMFAPLLGFASDEALVLARAGADLGLDAEPQRLSPTLRPVGDVEPDPGGVYVHNWFTIDGGSQDEFVRLSGEAWPRFEARFETKIYGLFLAAESDADRAEGARRLLLMTRYRDLGEWQTSRDPTSDAMAVFLRRRELTRVSLARSCLVMPRG